jgi:hypothetical protein
MSGGGRRRQHSDPGSDCWAKSQQEMAGDWRMETRAVSLPGDKGREPTVRAREKRC